MSLSAKTQTSCAECDIGFETWTMSTEKEIRLKALKCDVIEGCFSWVEKITSNESSNKVHNKQKIFETDPI